MGGSAAGQPARYNAAVADCPAAAGYSPSSGLGRGGHDRPQKLFEPYEAKAKQAGDTLEIIRVAGSGHHELCSTETASWPKIVGALRRLLK